MPVLECSRCNELYYSAHGSTELACDVCGGEAWRVFEDEVSFARVSGLEREAQPGDHAVLLYTEVPDAADFCADYLREGLALGEHALLAVPAPLREELIERLSPEEAAGAVVLEAERIYGPEFDAERVAEAFAQRVREQEGPVRLLCGVDGQTVAGVDLDEWRRYERIAHELVLELKATVLCTYDGRRLPIAFSPIAVETHPLISHGGAELRRNDDFRYEPANAGRA